MCPRSLASYPLGHFGPVGQGGQRGLSERASRGLLHARRKTLRVDRHMTNFNRQTSNRQTSNWQTSPRWRGITRPYTQQDVNRLRGSFQIEHTLARHGAERLWNMLQDTAESFVPALGAMTGNQAVQQVKAGLKAIYVSGWQVAADANDAG